MKGAFSCGADRCLLCDEVREDEALSALIGRYRNARERNLAESRNFLLIPDISPVIAGHSLLIPKEHVSSFAELPRCLDTELAAFKTEAAQRLLRAHGTKPFFFEHGCRPESSFSAACIAHAHLHLFPSDVDVLRHLQELSAETVALSAPNDVRAMPRKEDDYLYYEDAAGRSCVVGSWHSPLPKQLIRRIVAQEKRLEEWDWRQGLVTRPHRATRQALRSEGSRPDERR